MNVDFHEYKKMKEQFTSLMIFISNYEPNAMSVLNEGTTDEILDEASFRLNMPIQGDLRELYKTTNGVRRDNSLVVTGSFPGYYNFYMLSINEVENEVNFIRSEEYLSQFSHEPWIPVFADGSGNYLFVDANSGEVLYFDVDRFSDARNVLFSSLQ